jgi:uncharacterized membrane protein YdjX (TVP38/TMEM64 family)
VAALLLGGYVFRDQIKGFLDFFINVVDEWGPLVSHRQQGQQCRRCIRRRKGWRAHRRRLQAPGCDMAGAPPLGFAASSCLSAASHPGRTRTRGACSAACAAPLQGYLAYAAVYTGLEVLAVPAIPLTMTAGVIFGPAVGTLIVSASATTAATIAFLIARYAARDKVRRAAAACRLKPAAWLCPAPAVPAPRCTFAQGEQWAPPAPPLLPLPRCHSAAARMSPMCAAPPPARPLLQVMALAAKNPKWAAIDKAIGRDGFKFVTLLRLSPLLPLAASNYLYGLTSVELGPYVLGSWLGMLPGTWAYVGAGAWSGGGHGPGCHLHQA